MRVLLVGCGSIGKRHLQNLNRLNEVKSICVYSKVNGCLNTLKDRHKVSLVRSLDNVQADLAVIANETYKHLDTAIALAGKGINLFIEKPLSHCLSGKLNLLKKIIGGKKIKLCVGYNLRFLGALKLIKTRLSKGALGDIYFVKIEVGQYLPSWRGAGDYRLSYSSSKNRGGGAALDLSHEIDYMRYLFGDPLSWQVTKAKVSSLKIDSDDVFEGTYLFDNFVCSVHLDYLQKNKKRIIRIEGSKGTLICDLIKKRIETQINGRREVLNDKKLFDIDKTYIEEITSLINAVKRNRKPEVTLEDGIRVLKLIEDQSV